MYGTVPATTPVAVSREIWGVGSVAALGSGSTRHKSRRASPKSATLTTPSLRTSTLAGLKSRCTRPTRCAAASPRPAATITATISAAGRGVCSHGAGRPRRRSPSRRRHRASVRRRGLRCLVGRSGPRRRSPPRSDRTDAQQPWASRINRRSAVEPVSPAIGVARTSLTATRRPRRASVAANTAPAPALPEPLVQLVTTQSH